MTANRRADLLCWLLRVAAVAALLGLWSMSVRFGWVDRMFLASPLDTVSHLTFAWQAAGADLYATLTSFLAAFLIAVVAAVAVGFAINLSDDSVKILLPLLATGLVIPKVVLLPLFILWFGIGRTPVVVFGALAGFFPMVINVIGAGREVKNSQVLLARTLGYGWFAIGRKVMLPAMLPVLSSGSFYACNASLMGVFVVELVLARNGLGAIVRDFAMTFRTPELYAVVLITASVAVTINLTLWYLARFFGRWRV